MDYFKRINAHIQGDMDIDAVALPNNEDALVISFGYDDIISWKNVSASFGDSMELPSGHNFNKIALHPSGDRFLLGGGTSKSIYQYSMATKEAIKTMHQSLGEVFDFKYSPTGKHISIASGEQKVVIIGMQSHNKMKCRPGHSSKVYNTFFSAEGRYVASIGEDGYILIYEILDDKDPKEVFRTKYANEPLSHMIQGCFSKMKQGYRVFVPGQRELYVVQQLMTRWEIKKSTVGHTEPILVAQALNSNILATSCTRDLCLWSIDTQQKLVSFEDCPMTKILPIPNSFVGSKNDGNIYIYNRALPRSQLSHERLNEIEDEENGSRIQFDNQEQHPNIELEYDDQENEQQQIQELHKRSKKRNADKIILALPQLPLLRATTFFDESRFAHMNSHGYIIETREGDELTVFAQFNRQSPQRQPHVKQLFKGKSDIQYFDMNSKMVAYASNTVYGLKIDSFSSWEKEWTDIQRIALSGAWLAVANTSEIKIVDVSGVIVRSISFDRPIVEMQAYENLLAVVYHEGIPMYTSQLLSMKIFAISHAQANELPECHVPLTAVNGSQSKGTYLNWFGFSSEGMIFSQDSLGIVRSYSLQTNEWTPLIVQTLPDSRKAWIVGIEHYQIKFWRTTDSEPEPTVRPRLKQKQSRLMMTSLMQNPQQLQSLPHLLWRRYCLDHEMARWRLWSKHKVGRTEKHISYNLSKSILNEKQLYDEHLKLDLEFYAVIKHYIKTHQIDKALGSVKSFIRTTQAGKNLVDLFDECNHRAEAIELESYYEEKDRELQYEAIQELALEELKSKIKTAIASKKSNPMDPKFRNAVKSPIPYTISSQPSQNSSMVMEDITHKSQQPSKVMSAGDEAIQNPFLKKKSTNDRQQMLEEHIQKYAVKKKVEDKKGNKSKL